MRWERFLEITSELPIIDTELLLAGITIPEPVRVQISRWEKTGKLIQIKRGIYVLSSTYRKNPIFEPYIAFILKMPSYISLEKALEYHGLIPEAVPVYSCVTTKRTGKYYSEIGTFRYYHINNSLFWGYEAITSNRQTAFMALPEKALLDLFYLKEVKVTTGYLEEMRLENTEKINIDILLEFAKKFRKSYMVHTAEITSQYITSCRSKEKIL